MQKIKKFGFLYILYLTIYLHNALWTFLVPKQAILSDRIIERFFFIFSKFFAVFDDFSKWRVPNVLQNSEKSSNIAIFTNI